MVAKRTSVLLVEDNKLIRKMSVLMLEQLECRVDAVETGTLALEYTEKCNYDIIFMDIGLPDIDGLSIINKIRTEGKLNRDAPIIALTAHSDKKYIEQSYAMGATDFLVKPFSHIIGREVLQRYTEREPNSSIVKNTL